jgi:hypothetical protein
MQERPQQCSYKIRFPTPTHIAKYLILLLYYQWQGALGQDARFACFLPSDEPNIHEHPLFDTSSVCVILCKCGRDVFVSIESKYNTSRKACLISYVVCTVLYNISQNDYLISQGTISLSVATRKVKISGAKLREIFRVGNTHIIPITVLATTSLLPRCSLHCCSAFLFSSSTS